MIAIIIAFLCIIFWLIPVHWIIAGLGLILVNGGSIKPLKSNDPYFTKLVHVPKFDKKWAMGDIVDDYPECPFIGTSRIHPVGVKVEGFDVSKLDRRKLHWGQRKLLLSEIDFLSANGAATVVYAGAADGKHIPLLTELFPELVFHVYDPHPFNPLVHRNDRIKVNPFYAGAKKSATYGFFTDEVARSYIGKPIWFISDIRTDPKEEGTMLDQTAQKGWVEIMKPNRTMLKYKMPYPQLDKTSDYEYFDGQIRLQCWAPISSAETRLIFDSQIKCKKWNVIKYERQMSWFNNVMRLADLSNYKLRDFGVPLDQTVREFWSEFVSDDTVLGYDFVYELQILKKYIDLDGAKIKDYKQLVQKMNDILLVKHETFDSRLRAVTLVKPQTPI